MFRGVNVLFKRMAPTVSVVCKSYYTRTHVYPLLVHNNGLGQCLKKFGSSTFCMKSNDNQPIRPPKSSSKNLRLLFTCKICDFRNSYIISNIAYTKGVVVVDCKGCKNKHLIADNLGWFPNLEGKKNIEEILASKGEKVRKTPSEDDVLEILDDTIQRLEPS